ncbi:MAG: metabolite traffic protein EboE, partial [Bacteroidetes bacterium]|nr:metabolite traffic protein EboE [Bacteroidota bacterium]
MNITTSTEKSTVSHSYHLSYCTNIHPGESWTEVFQSLKAHVPAIKKQLSPHAPFGLGLRLSNQASLELLEDNRLQYFKQWLEQEGVYIFTFNGFPYGGFHHQVVKDQVHSPDWTSQERLNYSLRLFDILEALIPEGIEGGISTSPLTYKLWHPEPAAQKLVFEQASRQLFEVVIHLYKIREKTGKLLHLDIEPEPDGLLENTEELVNFFKDWLLPKGIPYLQQQLGLTTEQARSAILDHIQLCYDVCHFALAYEQPQEVFQQLAANGIRIGKIQISAALKARLAEDVEQREPVVQALRPFIESTYLHQVVERDADGQLTHYADLPEALEQLKKPIAREWRTHFHVPVFLES